MNNRCRSTRGLLEQCYYLEKPSAISRGPSFRNGRDQKPASSKKEINLNPSPPRRQAWVSNREEGKCLTCSVTCNSIIREGHSQSQLCGLVLLEMIDALRD